MRVVNYLQIKDVDEYIKKGHYNKLIRLSRDENKIYFLTNNFLFWISLSQALRATTKPLEMKNRLDIIQDKMTQCDNYNINDMAMWHLLNAEYWLKLNEYNLAIKQLEEIDKISLIIDTSHELYATKNLIEGVANYQAGKLRESMSNLIEANIGCRYNCKLKDSQDYQSKIKLYWLKIFVKMNNNTDERQKLAREISGGDYLINEYDWGYKGKLMHYYGDSNIVYRIRAKLINTGNLGNYLDDLIQIFIGNF